MGFRWVVDAIDTSRVSDIKRLKGERGGGSCSSLPQWFWLLVTGLCNKL